MEMLHPDCSRLALGTVQFGLDYGIANRGGQVAPAAVNAILECAWAGGITTLDTAHLYGDAETVVGQACARPFRVISKTPQFRRPITVDDAAAVMAAADRSCQRLRVARLGGLLVHHAADLLAAGGERLWQALVDLQAAGLVEVIGASVYTPDETRMLLQRYPLQLVQLPLNALDQRFLHSGMLDELQRQGVEIHVRSVLLQGLLTLPPAALDPWFAPLLPWLSAFRERAGQLGRTPIGAALGFALGLPQVSAVVCGVDHVSQLQQLLTEAQAEDRGRFEDLAGADPHYLLPSNWPVHRNG